MPTFPKRPRLLLEAEVYDQLRLQVLQRDGWRCQICEDRNQLDVHHVTTRNRGDAECNLLTLCRVCRHNIHNLT